MHGIFCSRLELDSQKKRRGFSVFHAYKTNGDFLLFLRSFDVEQSGSVDRKKFIKLLFYLLFIGPIYYMFRPKHEEEGTPKDISIEVLRSSPIPPIALGIGKSRDGIPKIITNDKDWWPLALDLIEKAKAEPDLIESLGIPMLASF